MRQQSRLKTIYSKSGVFLRVTALILAFTALCISFAYSYFNRLAGKEAEYLFAQTLGNGAAPQYEHARARANLYGALMGVSLAFSYVLIFSVFEHRKQELAADNARILQEKLRLETSEARYRLIERDSGAIIIEVDYVKGTIEANDLFDQFAGEGPRYEYFLNGARVHPDDRPVFFELVKQADAPTRNPTGELRMRDADGRYHWFSAVMCGIMDETERVVRVVCKLTNIDAQKRKMELLELQAQTDPMTGLYNKAVTEEIISRVLRDEPENIHALLILDLDDLKHINDTYGHAEGDNVIKAVAQLLRRHFRATDIAGRVGGDEFMVLLRNIRGKEPLYATLSMFRQRLEQLNILEAGHVHIGLSIGAVLTTGGANERFSELYRKADEALYSIKRNGKEAFALYGEPLPPDDGE